MKLLLTSLLLTLLQPGFAWQPSPDTSRELHYTLKRLNTILLPAEQWKPYPDLSDPQNRELIPPAIRNAYIRKGEKLLPVDWKPLPATVFLEFERTGNRDHYEELSFQRRANLADLVLAETFERKGRFLDQIINGIWAICEESYWGVPAHLFLQPAGAGLPDITEPTVDLFASETGVELAWVYYLLKPELDKINLLIAQRIREEVNKRILKPYLEHYDWSYLGYLWKAHLDSLRRVNNWNPWVNSNVLATALILGNDEIRSPVILKTTQSINHFILPYPEDGGSDEGPQYWSRGGASVFEYLELLKSATAGKADHLNMTLLKKMGRYIYRMHIKNDYYISYGDADAKISPDPALLYRFGKEVRNDTLQRFAALVAQHTGFGKNTLNAGFGVLNRVIPALFVAKQLLATKAQAPLLRDVWLPDTEVMAARSKEGTAEGLYLVVKGGNNGASHNHNDIGNFCVYADGQPVLIDAGALNYTRETFSNNRYSIWNNRSGYHSVPSINGMEQGAGAAFGAKDLRYSSNDQQASLSMDLAPAYPAAAEVSSWIRKTTLDRKKHHITIQENYRLTSYKEPFTENFITPLPPSVNEEGKVTLTPPGSDKSYRILYEKNRFYAVVDTVIIDDGHTVEQDGIFSVRKGRMQQIWGDTLYRIRLISTKKALSGRFTIIVE